MYKLLAMYAEPSAEDKAKFEEHYFNVHVPLCEKLPGLVRSEVSMIKGTPPGMSTPYYMITELVFESKEAHDTAMATPEGKAVGKDTRNFPPGLLTIAFAETKE
jgi:uncharacterized protein (TIGR02118 family)